MISMFGVCDMVCVLRVCIVYVGYGECMGECVYGVVWAYGVCGVCVNIKKPLGRG